MPSLLGAKRQQKGDSVFCGLKQKASFGPWSTNLHRPGWYGWCTTAFVIYCSKNGRANAAQSLVATPEIHHDKILHKQTVLLKDTTNLD